jgi:excinuclease UvrABC nuclease subunit
LEFTGEEGLRPCLYHHLDQCLAPCNRRYCPPEEYAEAVRDALDFLEGRQAELIARLGEEMEAAAEELRFERAARLRDMRESVIRWMERQNFLAAWEDPATGIRHLFFVHGARLSGHCAVTPEERRADAPSWRLAALKALRETYVAPREAATLLGSIEIEELNILESWLQRKKGVKAFVSPPRDAGDFPALEAMMAQIEAWVHPAQRNEPASEPIDA